MYYKIEKGTKLYDQLEKLTDKMEAVHEAALKEMQASGGVAYIQRMHVLSGGIAAIRVPDGKPAQFKQFARRHYNDMYCPNVRNKEVQQRWDSLPVVEIDELNDLIGYKSQMIGSSNTYSFNPSLHKRGDVYLISTSLGVKYKPVEGMTEILASEYQSIKGENE